MEAIRENLIRKPLRKGITKGHCGIILEIIMRSCGQCFELNSRLPRRVCRGGIDFAQQDLQSVTSLKLSQIVPSSFVAILRNVWRGRSQPCLRLYQNVFHGGVKNMSNFQYKVIINHKIFRDERFEDFLEWCCYSSYR